MKKYTVTLNKLNKIVELVGKSKSKKMVSSFISRETNTISSGPENIIGYQQYVSTKTQQIESAHKGLIDSLMIDLSHIHLKSILFEMNVKYGVHDILTSIAIAKKTIDFYEDHVKEIENKLLTEEQFNRIPLVAREGTVNVMQSTIKFHPVTIIPSLVAQEKIKQSRQMINKLNDELSTLNATKTVDIELEDVVAEIVGFE